MRLLILLAGISLLLPSCESQPRRDPEAIRFDEPKLGANLELLKEGDKLFRAHKYEEAKHAYARAARASGPPNGYVEACAQVARMESLQGTPLEGEPWLRMAAGGGGGAKGGGG